VQPGTVAGARVWNALLEKMTPAELWTTFCEHQKHRSSETHIQTSSAALSSAGLFNFVTVLTAKLFNLKVDLILRHF